MDDEKIIARVIPDNACPNCGHKRFVVMQSQIDAFLTNIDGEVCDSAQRYYNAVGKCLSCSREYNMLPTPNGFIPMGPLKSLLYKHMGVAVSNDSVDNVIENPMMLKME